VRIVAEAVLPAPPARVWAFLLDWERQAAWMHDADRVTVVSPNREGVGVTLAVRTRILGIPLFTDRLEVLEWDPPRLLRLAHRRFVHGTGEWRLDPDPPGTRFAWTEDLSIAVPLLGEAALLAYRPVLRRLMRRSLSNLGSALRARSL
jgi:uncharacterized protein YndB with AHSA1/START domain